MRHRLSALVVIAFWIAGPIVGADCFWSCPTNAPFPSATAASEAPCHQEPAASDVPAFGAMHDCGDHQAAATPATVQLRHDLQPVVLATGPLLHTFTGMPAFVDAPPAHPHTTPPVRFLRPLRQ